MMSYWPTPSLANIGFICYSTWCSWEYCSTQAPAHTHTQPQCSPHHHFHSEASLTEAGSLLCPVSWIKEKDEDEEESLETDDEVLVKVAPTTTTKKRVLCPNVACQRGAPCKIPPSTRRPFVLTSHPSTPPHPTPAPSIHRAFKTGKTSCNSF